ncbi:hypothetical protein Bhyg_08272 [Pseudolycoriella hygida]|uniref:Uncharacterized protein n=1 Tax=Pseudolycoriella hygida TaxID=35572 RepID=A0A9Q0N4C0_9DIPT|nr:hypothetical protein Bhyg_08272 [Pseudolycoriella hygida]
MINYKPIMSEDVESIDVLNLSVIFENDEETLDEDRVYHFYKYGESIEDTAMRIKLKLAEYERILDCLYQHSEQHRSIRSRLRYTYVSATCFVSFCSSMDLF